MESRPSPVAAVVLAMLAQGVGGGLAWSIVPPLMPSIAKDIAMGPATIGLIWGLVALGIALASPLGGAAVDRFGPRRVGGLALLVGAATCALRAFVHTPAELAAAMFLFGLHIGFTAPAVPKLLGAHVALHKLARANGLALLTYTLGTALAVLTATTVLAPACGGWRNLMLVAAAAVTVVAVIWLVVARDRVLLSKHAGLRDVFALASNRPLLCVGAMQFLIFGGYLALLGTLPFVLKSRGVEGALIGKAIAAWLVAAAIANFAGPAISDRMGRRRPVLLVGGAVAGVSLLGFALLPAGASWLLMLSALGGGMVSPMLLALPLELPGVGPSRVGAALGLLMLVGQAGGFLLPTLAGTVAQHLGFNVALGVLALLHLAVVVPASLLPETGPAAGERAAAPALEVA